MTDHALQFGASFTPEAWGTTQVFPRCVKCHTPHPGAKRMPSVAFEDDVCPKCGTPSTMPPPPRSMDDPPAAEDVFVPGAEGWYAWICLKVAKLLLILAERLERK